MNDKTKYDGETISDEDKEIITEALERFKRAEEAEADNHERARECIQFADLEQWPEQVRQQRANDPDGARPTLVLDKAGQYVRQVENDQRQARPAIKIDPFDDKADPKTAKALQGLIRNIESQSLASVAYDTAFSHTVNGGFGYWRVLTDYVDEDAFYQDIRVTRIRNRFSVLLDPDRQMPDGSDAAWGFIISEMHLDTFKDEYPKAKQTSWDDIQSKNYPDWLMKDKLRLVEYYKFKYSEEKIYLLEGGIIATEKEYEEATVESNPDYFKAYDVDPESPDTDTITQEKKEITAERMRDTKKLCWYKLNAMEILEREELPTKYIPIVEVIGNEIDDDGVSKKSGLLRAAMDAQRLYNYAASAFTEQVALQPKAPYIAADGQIEDYEEEWESANVNNTPVLRYKPITVDGHLAPAPQRQPSPGISSGWAQAMIQFEHDLQASMGMYNPSVGAGDKVKSGKALFAEQEEADAGNFHYQDNLALSIAYTGRIILDMLPYYYDTKRVSRIIGDDGTEEMVELDPSQTMSYRGFKASDGKFKEIYNIHVGKYDVTVSTGPSYSSKRQKVVDMLGQIINGNPEMMKMVGDLFFSNMDWQGADDVADRLKKMLPPELQDTDDDGEPDGANQEFTAMIEQLKAQLQEVTEGQEARKIANEEAELKIKKFEADTKRMAVTEDDKIAALAGSISEIQMMLQKILTTPLKVPNEQ